MRQYGTGSRVRALGLAALTAFAAAAFTPAHADSADVPEWLQDCGTDRCLGIELSAQLVDDLGGSEGAAAESAPDELTYHYVGDDEIVGRLIAARYRNGRLVRYAVSDRNDFAPGAGPLQVDGAERALADAWRAIGAQSMHLLDVGEEHRRVRVVSEQLVGTLPPTQLILDDAGGLLADVFDGEGSEVLPSDVGVVFLITDDIDLRGDEHVSTWATVVGLQPLMP